MQWRLAGRRGWLWMPIVLTALWLGGVQQVSAAVRAVLPAGCPAVHAESSAESGFIDRLGDPRFLPRRLRPTADMRTIVQPRIEGPLVAAAAIDTDTLLIANYKTIQSVNTRTGAGGVLRADLTRLDNAHFIPTGIAVGPKSGNIYIANYLANNVLIGALNNSTLVFDRKIIGDDLISPENIAISADETWIATANFDGNSATGFAFENGEFRQKWATRVPLAHGVTIIGQYVFISSLELRKIFVLDLVTGTVLGSFGEPGWNAYCLNFLWPTSVYTMDDRTIIVTDAHTGGVYRLGFDGETIRLIDVVGGTAPGWTGLQMPYGAAILGGELAVLSTFSPKVVIAGPGGDGTTLEIKRLVLPVAHPTGGLQQDAAMSPLGAGWNGYIHLAGPRLRISGIEIVPSYGALEAVTGAGPLGVERPFALNPATLSLFGSLMYFIEAQVVGSGAVLSSPSAPYAMYVTLGTTGCITKLDLPGAPLATSTGLEHWSGLSPYDELKERALRHLREVDARRGAHGFLPPVEIGNLLGTGEDWAKVLPGDWGRRAAQELQKCASGELDEPSCRRIAAELRADALRNGMSLFALLAIDASAHRCVG
jgi:hypothetical protein